ncbi:DUF4097 family beta strand repeat-containing protein [Streptomyces sp. NPDC003077]|uniref:DUF4097 family beta strand repeat-containing protein n=1 Tax=Streptomyces sp. NPDC003077 TaxID=3154443 RepID=UPI0033AAC601
MTGSRTAAPAHQAPRSGRRAATVRRAAGAVLVCAALAAVVTGCQVTDDTRTSERTYMVDGKVTAISAVTDGGDIDIVAADEDGGPVRVTEHYRYADRKPKTEHHLKDGVLTLKAEDCAPVTDSCEVGYEVRVPRTLAVTLRTDGGNIQVRGTTGAVQTDTAGGNIQVRDTTGTVQADTDGGNVSVENVSTKKATVRSGGGNVIVRLTDAPDLVDASTGGGNVQVSLPKGPYAVDARTEGGESSVTVPSDAGSSHKVKVRSDGGDVIVGSAS